MRFNRLVLLQPHYWHTSGIGFGNSVENGRLVYLTFFMRASRRAELFPRRFRLDRERMDPISDQLTQCAIHQPLPLDPRFARKFGAFDPQSEVALARRIVAAVAAMLFAIVDQLDSSGIQRIEAPKHFGCNRSRGSDLHRAYIWLFE